MPLALTGRSSRAFTDRAGVLLPTLDDDLFWESDWVFRDAGGALVPATLTDLSAGASGRVFTDAGLGAMRDALLMSGGSDDIFTDSGGSLTLVVYGGPWTRDNSQKTVIHITPRATGRLTVPVVMNPWDGT